MIKFNVTLTELAKLTGKTRPTIYNYMNLYEERKLDKVPYSFVKLFEMLEENATHNQIVNYCKSAFESESPNNLDDALKTIKASVSEEDFEKILTMIKEK